MSSAIEAHVPIEPQEGAVASESTAISSRRMAGRAVRGGAVLLATRVAMQLFVWSVTLWVARILTPDDYGLMTMAMVFVVLGDLLAEAGFSKALIHKENLGPEDVSTAFSLSMAFAVPLYGLLFFLSAPLERFLALQGFTPLLQVVGLLVLLVPFRAIPLALLDRDLRLGRQAVVSVVCSVAQSAMVLGLALAGARYWSLAAGAITSRLLEVIVTARAAGWRPTFRWPGKEGSELLRFGMHASFASLLWFVYSNSDFAIVGKLAGAVELGYYALAFQLISLPVQKITANANQVAYPVFCRLRDNPARLRGWYLRLTVLLGFLSMPALAEMALVAGDAFAVILGPRWLPAVLPFQLLSIVGILMVYGSTLPPLFNALGRPDVNSRYALACTLLYPTGFIIGGWLWGVRGVCVAWLILYPLVIGSLTFFTKNLTGVGPAVLMRAQVPVLGAVLFMTSTVILVRESMQNCDRPWLRLCVCILCGVISYAGVLLIMARHTVLADVRALIGELRGGKKG